MTELFVLEPVAVDEPAHRVPDNLPLTTPERDTLEKALRKTGYAIVAVDAVVEPVDGGSDEQATERRLRAAVTAVVNESNASELERLEAAALAHPNDDLDEKFWGRGSDSVSTSRAVFIDLRDQFEQRRQLAANSISRDEAAELLGVAPQSITAKLAAHKLVGIKVGREWRLPRWQFDPDHPAGVLPDLDDLQTAFPGGPVSLSSWMFRAQPEFDGRTARAEMALRGSGRVVDLARALTATAW